MEHFYNMDSNSLIGTWMLLGCTLALVAAQIAQEVPQTKPAIQFFYNHPYSIGVCLILGPLFAVFNIEQAMRAAR